MSISEKVLTLLTVGQRAFRVTDALSLKNRFLFALTTCAQAPSDLCECLRQDKSNIAHLAAALEKEGLIQKDVTKSDKRRVRYSLSEAGREKITGVLKEADARFSGLFDSSEAQTEAEQKLDDVIRLFSFL